MAVDWIVISCWEDVVSDDDSVHSDCKVILFKVNALMLPFPHRKALLLASMIKCMLYVHVPPPRHAKNSFLA